MADAKKVAKEKDTQHRINYKCDKIRCGHCGKQVLRGNIYKHYKSKQCGYKSDTKQTNICQNDILLQNILDNIERTV